MFVSVFESVTFARLLQPTKASDSMLVTLSGITILVNPVQLWNAAVPIIFISFEIVIPTRLPQFSNARAAMLVPPVMVTENCFEIICLAIALALSANAVMFVKLRHPTNASSHICNTLAGTVTLVNPLQ